MVVFVLFDMVAVAADDLFFFEADVLLLLEGMLRDSDIVVFFHCMFFL